jgi:outer membrane receptor protein involved in Fe transport
MVAMRLRLALLSACASIGLAAADTPPKPRIEEIVVTAQKRSEKLSRVPISIAALGRAQMDKQGVRRIEDISRLVPGLHLQPSNELGDTNISIRGIVSNTGAETTGVYIDDTPVQARQEIVASNPYPRVFDLDRVEVLRGPQGTLFGAGSEGGTVRFITPEPSLEKYTGYLRSEVGFTDGGAPSEELGGAIGGPIIPGELGFRASLWAREDGGYINRVNPVTDVTTQHNANSASTVVSRGAIKWLVTDDFSLTPAIYYQRIRAEDRDYYWEAAGPFNAYAQIPQPHADTFVLPSLTAKYNLDWAALTIISSYFRRVNDDKFDATSYELSGLLPNNGINLPGDPAYLSRGAYHQQQHDWTEEIRLASADTDARFSWIVGFFYQNNESSDGNTFAEPFDQVANFLSEYYDGVPGNSLSYFGEGLVDGKYSYLQQIKVDEEDKAGFAGVTYKITPTVKLSAGLRVESASYSYADFQDGPYGPGAPTSYGGGESEMPVTPRVSLSWQINPDEMIYATVAKGYRIGGANESVLGVVSCAGDLARLGLTDVPHTFASDSVWSYETGLKGSYLDHTLRIAASIFWIDWENIQQQVELPDCGYYYTANLGAAVSRGFDLDAEWTPSHGLTLSGTAGLTDARFTKDEFVGGNLLARAGDSLATPEWSATAAIQRDIVLPGDATLYARADYQFSGPYYRTGSAGTFSYDAYVRNAPATNYVSLRCGWKRAGWDASLFIDNALNSRPSLFRYHDTLDAPGLRDSTFRPLTVGITVIDKF